jgi:hypothetical protein
MEKLNVGMTITNEQVKVSKVEKSEGEYGKYTRIIYQSGDGYIFTTFKKGHTCKDMVNDIIYIDFKIKSHFKDDIYNITII